MRFISKEAWGSNLVKEATEDSHPIGSTLGITAHWIGDGTGSLTHAECYTLVRGIERSHEYGNGWGDIAYNLLPCRHGYVFEGRGVGVRSSANGSTEANGTHYAVCYLGGTGDPFTAEGRQAMLDAFGLLRDQGGAGPERNGHRDHKSTQCPGDAIYAWVSKLPAGAGADLEEDMSPEQMEELADLVVEKLLNMSVPSSTSVHKARKVSGMLTSTERLAAAAAKAAGAAAADLADEEC